MKTSGVYCIINLTTGRQYFGSTTNLSRRKNEHKNKLFSNQHTNKELQKDFNNSGLTNFKFVVLQRENIDLGKIEREYIENSINTYNKALPNDKGTGTLKQAESTKDLLSEISKQWIIDNPNQVKLNKENARITRENQLTVIYSKTRKIAACNDSVCHIFNSITQASEELDTNIGRIKECLLGYRIKKKGIRIPVVQVKGYKFVYII